MEFTVGKAPLGLNKEMYGWTKHQTPKGHVAKAIRDWTAAGLLGGEDQAKAPAELQKWSAVFMPARL